MITTRMASSPLEKRTTMVSTGRLPSRKLLESSSRPFVHQVDVVFPFDHELQAAFSELETDYYTSRAPLAEIYESLRMYGRESGSGLSSDALVASTGTYLPDAWSCREGELILSAGKETFESLGLPSAQMSASGAPDQYLIRISLKTPSVNVRGHDFIVDSITRWDRTREESGQGQWDFAFHVSHPEKGTGPLLPSHARHHNVTPNIQHLQNVYIPTFALPPRPTTSNRRGRHRDLSHGEKVTDSDDNDALEDWNERASELFEWVGMVNNGAQRLQANDRVDPYVAVYSPPAPFTVGDMVHMQWHGFLTPQFVQRIVDTATTLLPRRKATSPSGPLIGLTIHGSTGVPISTPPRVPRLEGEDTVCIILAHEGSTDETVSSGEKMGLDDGWVMIESIGKWDSRFG